MARFAMAKGAPPANKSQAAASDVTVNRAGGEAFSISDPSLRMLTMLGSSFFNEPNYYGKSADGEDAALGLSGDAANLLETAKQIARGDNPRDLLALALWARTEMNVRSTPQVLLALAASEPKTKPFVRQYARKIVQRADEVRQVFAAYLALFAGGVAQNKRGQKLPNSLKRGLADAIGKFSEAQLMKYDSADRPTFKDVLRMIDRGKDFGLPQPVYKYLVSGEVVDAAATPVIAARKALAKKTSFDAEALALIAASHANWEVVLSQFGGSSRAVWDAVLPQMGYMALLRNLRNMLQAGVDPEPLAKRLSDPREVAKSKQLPFRFYTAHKMLVDAGLLKGKNAVVASALETALEHAASALPRLTGVTVIASDNSGSMSSPVSAKSIVTHQAAANMLAAIAQRVSDDGHVIVFGESARLVPVTVSDSILTAMSKQASTNVGHATNAHKVLEVMLEKKIVADRLVLFSDMQCYSSSGGPETFSGAVAKYRSTLNPKLVVHSVDLAGYGTSTLSSADPRVNLVSGFSEKIMRTVVEFERALDATAVPASNEGAQTVPATDSVRVLATLDDIRARF
jgi:60 kDa SS-A/Ro ribonucleoprotein